MTRILHVTQPTTAGVALAVRQLSGYQSDLGLEVAVACPEDGPLAADLRETGIPVHVWSASRSPGPWTADEIRRLRRVIASTDPDVVHLHSSKAGLAGRLAVRGRRCTVFHPNGWSFLPPGPTQPLARAWERAAARWTDLFVLVSQSELAIARSARIGGSVCLVRNGIDLARFPRADASRRAECRQHFGLPDAPIAVCVGRLCEQKGQLELVRAWSTVRAKLPDAYLVLVGDGPDRPEIEAQQSEGVLLVGERNDVSDWLAAADIAVQPSRWEGQSFATVEAMATGRPVVAYDVEGMAETIGATGRVAPAGNVHALSLAIIELLSDDALRASLGADARRRAEQHHDARQTCATITERTLEAWRKRDGLVALYHDSGRSAAGPIEPASERGTRLRRIPAEPGVPTFLLIGAARSGTTYLAHHLGRHPDVVFADPKEPHFLAYEGVPTAFNGPGDDTVLNRVAVLDRERWKALFPGGALAQGEGSVSTLYHPEHAVPRIQELCPDADLLVVLREPAERAHSAWSYQVSRGFETLSFEDALDAEPERIASGWQHLWHYVEMGRYARQLRPFIDAFGLDRILVIDYDELRSDPASVLHRSFRFIGVQPVTLGGLEQGINAGGEPRSELVTRVMNRARSIEPLRRAVRAAVPVTVRERIRSANLRSTTLPEATRKRLDSEFEPDRVELLELLGDRAPNWARR